MKKVKVKITIPDQRMLELPDLLKENNLIRFRQEFTDVIEMPKQNIRNVKAGIQHFTAMHIARACKEFGVNANWIMGIKKELPFPYQGNGEGRAAGSNENSNKKLKKK